MRDNSGPPCPKPQRVRELIELVGSLNDEMKVGAQIGAGDSNDLIDSLDWLATMLENRSLYHKKQQIKNKTLRILAKEYGIEDQANVITNDAMHALVSNQPPDKRDIIDLTEINKLQGDNTDE
jgi:hypothetical protein